MEKLMKRMTTNLPIALLIGTLLFPASSGAQTSTGETAAPMKSSAQDMSQRNFLTLDFTTEIIAVDDEGRARAQRILEMYELLATNPTIEGLSEYVVEGYVQHSPMLPNGPEGIASFFASSVAQYPVSIDVHRIIVVDDWAVAHVNFRNLDTEDPDDLGASGIDIYTFGPDGRATEHWDAVQGVPTFSVNSNGMFLRVVEE